MSEFAHKFVDTNGIKMHLVEAGQGFPVVMCHGFPELWYSWRHQIRALADAGFRAIAPISAVTATPLARNPSKRTPRRK